MMDTLFSINILKRIFNSENSRTAAIKKNALIMFIIKGFSVLLSFIMLPLTIGYVSSSIYGIYVTINSIVNWFSFFDVGLSSGLKNRFAENKAKGDILQLKKYVSTTYALLTIISLPLCVLLILFAIFTDWQEILNIQTEERINFSVCIIVFYFFSSFILNIITVMLTADLKPAASSFIVLAQQLSSVLVLLLLIKTTEGNLLKLCCALCIPPLIITLIATIYLYMFRYRAIKPSLSCVDFSMAKDLFSLGFKFFIIQISCIVLFQTSNFIMIRSYGADVVTQYNVIYKYLFLLNIVFNILLAPLWPSVTDAIAKNDLKWVQNIIKKYTYIVLVFFGIGFILLLLSPILIHLWMGDKIENIPFVLSFCVYLYLCETMMANLYAQVLAGAEIFKLEIIICFVSPILFFVLCYIFIDIFHWGVQCVPIAIVIANFYGLFISPLQCYLVFFRNKKGIWAAK